MTIIARTKITRVACGRVGGRIACEQLDRGLSIRATRTYTGMNAILAIVVDTSPPKLGAAFVTRPYFVARYCCRRAQLG
jgi:hypothetical protein